MRRMTCAVLVFLAGCGTPDGGDDLPPALPCDPSAPDGSAPTDGISYDADRMLCIGIEMGETEFLQLSAEHRLGDSTEEDIDVLFTRLSTDCATPFPNRFNWYAADLELGGRRLDQIGVRKKGFLGSVVGAGETKPALKIKTDAFVLGQTFGDVTERITLNNGIQDDSRVRTCLALSVFDAAGYPAPRCNLANVVVNGEPMGAFTNIESIKVRFLAREFLDATGSLYEATLADFTEETLTGAADGVLGRWEAKTDDTDLTGAPLVGLVRALDAPDAELEASLAPVLNLDLFITFWALEILLNADDGYAANRNNFYVYFDPFDGDRAALLPWGLDHVMTDAPLVDGEDPADLESFVYAELPRRLSRIPATAARLETELARLLADVWDEEAILADLDRFAAQVESAEDDPDYQAEVEELRDWVVGRRAKVEAMMAEGLSAGADETESCSEPTVPPRLFESFVVGCAATAGTPLALVLVFFGMRRRRAIRDSAPRPVALHGSEARRHGTSLRMR